MKLIQKDGIDIIIKNVKNTPRTAVCFYFSIDEEEKLPGIYTIFAKLMLKGTKKRTAEELADIIEANGMEASVKCKQDYLKISTLFLNEDFELALEIIADIIQNSTFAEFEKEVYKLKGEIISDLDSPQIKASDAFIGEIFKNHYYGHNSSKILESLDKIKKEDVIQVLDQIMKSKKVISIAGDFDDEEKIAQYFAKNFQFMKTFESKSSIEEIPPVLKESAEDRIIKIAKNDAKQAQVFQGRIIDTQFSEDYAKIAILNNILGSSGLSSRFFVELRDKQGLAYTVRSSIESLKKAAIMCFYIGTEPKNIQKSLDGFKIEVQKIIDTPPTETELQGAKENIFGRLEYFSQTNIQIASIAGYDYIMGLGLNYEEKYREMLMKVNREEVSKMAAKYLQNPSVISILAPEEYLKNIN